MTEHIAVESSQLSKTDSPEEGDGFFQPQFSQSEVENLLHSGIWYLFFPKALEKEYRKQWHNHSIKTYKFNGIFSFLVLAIICISIIRFIPDSSLVQCLAVYGFAILVMLSVRVLSMFRMFDRWFFYYVGFSATTMITVAVYANNSIPMGEGSTLSYIGLTYILFFAYCFVGLHLQAAILSNSIGAALGLCITYLTGSSMDWRIMPQIFGTASFLAMFLAYGLNRQERINFLQSYLLQLSLQKSEKLSREDSLTGLANRRHLNEHLDLELSRMLRYQLPLSIMMIDIDWFKRYNDELGHLAGDKCLQQIAKIIQDIANRSGEMAARYGGEEFVLLFPNIDSDSAKRQAERLLKQVSAAAIPHPSSEKKMVTVSIGISVCVPTSTTTVSQLLRQADQALYEAKSSGRNCFKMSEGF
jgi:diguanylate cyclase (GGDEF)-like protein